LLAATALAVLDALLAEMPEVEFEVSDDVSLDELVVDVVEVSLDDVDEVDVSVLAAADPVSAPASVTPTIRAAVRPMAAAAMPATATPARCNRFSGAFIATTLAVDASRGSQPTVKPVLRNAGNLAGYGNLTHVWRARLPQVR
jgi:hypothetical protein